MQITNSVIRERRLSSYAFAISLVIATLLFGAPPRAAAATIPVTNTNDIGAGSLRAAITTANNASDLDTISFSIPSSDPNCNPVTGVCTIALSSMILITRPVIIDGYTQSGAIPNTNPITAGSNAVFRIQLTALNGANIDGLFFHGSNSSGSIVRGLVMNRFGGSAIVLSGTSNNVIEGNFVGTDPTGQSAVPNGRGIAISSSANTNRIGGLSPAARNVISASGHGVNIAGNCSGNVVQGNFIGTNAAGTVAFPHFVAVRPDSNVPNTLIGGDTVEARNVIVGTFSGIDIVNTANITVQGNFINTDVTGTTVLSPGAQGISMTNVQGITIGGITTTPGMPPGNLIIGEGLTHNLGFAIMASLATASQFRGI